MPTRFVGIHLSLSFLVALFGLFLISDPCGGGGDLCLGGAVGLLALGVAALGGVGLFVWLVGRRASPLLVWDCVLLAVAGFTVLSGLSYAPGPLQLGAVLALLLSLGGAVLAARDVVVHRVEGILAVAALIALAIFGRESGLVVLVLGLLALGVGWLTARQGAGELA